MEFQYLLQGSIAVCYSHFMNLICSHFLQVVSVKSREGNLVYKYIYFMLAICSCYLSVTQSFIILAEDFSLV